MGYKKGANITLVEVNSKWSTLGVLVVECRGCRKQVRAYSPAGRRFIHDQLCTYCFKGAVAFGVKTGDLNPSDGRELGRWLRHTAKWKELVEAWLAQTNAAE